MMKRIIITALNFFLLVNIGSTQVLFTYGKNKVTSAEFIKAFDKNPGTYTNRAQGIKEYLNLYIRFKLKVQAAKDAKLNEDETLQYELHNFKHQIADNIINQESNIDELVKEAYERSLKDIHAAHVFIEVNNADTLAAYQKINQAYIALKSGKPFEVVAAEYSSDNAVKNAKGDLGWLTVFTFDYEVENNIYALKQNTYGMPVRTKFGYHIFKNIEERNALGSRKVAQILLAPPPQATIEERKKLKENAAFVYQQCKNNSLPFEELVKQYSNDVSTINTQGVLKDVYVGSYDASFENQVFALKKVGDISEPFETSFGFHIIKLIALNPVATDMKDPITLASLKEKVEKDNRLAEAKKLFINSRLKTIKYKEGFYLPQSLWIYTDSTLKAKPVSSFLGINDNTILFSFAKQQIKATDWAKFVKGIRSTNTGLSQLAYPDLMKEYIRITAGEYYKNHLEDYSIEYKLQVQEFEDANMLFAIMEQQVWNKAQTDSIGLKKYYESNKAKYVWNPSADALIITCKTEDQAKQLDAELLKNSINWRAITSQFGNDVIVDSNRYEFSQIPVIDRTHFQKGVTTYPVKNESDNSYTFSYIFNVYREYTQRSYQDALGLVVNDYQQVVEDKWLVELQKKYKVVVNQAVLKKLTQ